MALSDVKGLNLAQLQDKYALPFMPTHYVTVNANGTLVRGGYASDIFGGTGGGFQIELLNTTNVTYSKPLPIGGGI